MKHKLKKIVCILLVFTIGITVGFVIFNKPDKSFETEDNTIKIKEENTLSMMIEQTAGAGDYKLETRSSWPTSGYTFNTTLSKCENESTLSWDSTNGIVTMTGNVSDKCYVYFDVKPPSVVSDVCSGGEKLATCITTLSSQGGSNNTNIYHHDGSLTNGISDGSYRYAGASSSVNNYVCFGSTADTCPTDNLYRIIGVFGDQVKLIKATSIGDKSWDSSKNIWSTSSLNIYLNGDYLTGLTTTWSNKIAIATWIVAGNQYHMIYYDVIPKTVYTNEITTPDKGARGTEDTYGPAKIGLIYISDYLFAASESSWTLSCSSSSGSSYDYRSATSINWMYLGSTEWTITRNSMASSYNAHVVRSDGDVIQNGVTNNYAVRPVFYINSSVTYASGTGTSIDPIRIN